MEVGRFRLRSYAGLAVGRHGGSFFWPYRMSESI